MIPSVSLLKDPKRSAVSVLGRMFEATGEVEARGSSQGSVFIVKKREKSRGDYERTYAIKRTRVRDPCNVHDAAYRELRILLQLKELAARGMCANFVHLEEWMKSRPPLLFAGREVARPDDQYLYLVLDFAERTLAQVGVVPVDELRALAFQILYALSVAAGRHQLVHHDLHLRNILVQQLPDEQPFCAFEDAGSVWFTRGVMVRISDFGLSRMTLHDGEVVYNTANSFSELFLDSTDLEKLESELKKVKVSFPDPTTEKQERAALLHLFKFMRKGRPARQLLREPFFDALKECPESVAVYSQCCQVFASDGDTEKVVASLRGQVQLEALPVEFLAPASPAKRSRTMRSEVTAHTRYQVWDEDARRQQAAMPKQPREPSPPPPPVLRSDVFVPPPYEAPQIRGLTRAQRRKGAAVSSYREARKEAERMEQLLKRKRKGSKKPQKLGSNETNEQE